MFHEELGRSPICLTIPGLGGSGPSHWQSIWERERHDCDRIELGCWDDPVRNLWISRIDQDVRASPAPVILVAHSLGCLAVAWWAHLVGEAAACNVRGALLVAPPDVDRPGADQRIARFAPAPKAILPFRSIVVASRDDPYCTFDRAEELASGWLAGLIDAGAVGHINAASELGAWRPGMALLDRLLDQPPRPVDRAADSGNDGSALAISVLRSPQGTAPTMPSLDTAP